MQSNSTKDLFIWYILKYLGRIYVLLDSLWHFRQRKLPWRQFRYNISHSGWCLFPFSKGVFFLQFFSFQWTLYLGKNAESKILGTLGALVMGNTSVIYMWKHGSKFRSVSKNFEGWVFRPKTMSFGVSVAGLSWNRSETETKTKPLNHVYKPHRICQVCL